MYTKLTLNKVNKLTDNHILAVNILPSLLGTDFYGYTQGKTCVNSIVYIFCRDGKKLALSVAMSADNKTIGKKDDRYTSLVKRYNRIREYVMRDKRYHVELLTYLRKRFIRQLFRLEFGC